MSDYISREAAIEALCGYCNGRFGIEPCGKDCSLYRLMRNIHAADVQEVKRGKWEWDLFNIECPFCGFEPCFDSTEPLYHFCPNCGSQMEEQT